ncbi:HNH endonuclease signature motif containing protein [Armatimonas sp.]|uniref:HNH endonuclease n=1 Tax=Armatimonas sp. TaxID=1872638 RepID=UPI00286C6F41|nr:HNH endonuclease signature motif containing protein [Armatimonas sp.]
MAVVSERVREQVVQQADDICEYCRYPEEFNSGRFTVDHIEPRAQGGTDDLSNLALACRSCNEHKQDATQAPDPATGVIVPLFNPRQDRWEDHFAWSGDYRFMLGLTPTGRATIARLHTNHTGVVRQREILHQLGLHPVQDM